MPQRDIIVIGGSAGSIKSLRTVVSRLPGTLPVAVFVVVHRTSLERSWLGQVLNRVGALSAAEACDGEPISQGRIYVAPSDSHLLIAEGHVHLTHGPKEGLHRPSINVTFRSAARAYGNRVAGVLLSGMLDDGASGLWEIVHRGGVSIVQHPDEAEFPSMPLVALKDVPINYKLSSVEIGDELCRLATQSAPVQPAETSFVNEVSLERFSGFTCPECRGPLYEHRAEPLEFKCRVGHVFPLRTLLQETAATQERKMYEAVVSLEEGTDLAEQAAEQADPDDRERFLAEAKQLRECALTIKKLIEKRRAFSATCDSNPDFPPREAAEEKARERF